MGALTEFELFTALRPLYPAREYALLPQVADGTGAGSFRHCDAIALGLWPSRGMHLSGFEIKTYRGDWTRELKTPAKAEQIAKYCNYWWIVAARDFVKEGELPEPWGLMVWGEEKKSLKKIKQAKFREAEKPNLPFLAAMMRKAQEVVTPDGALAEARAEGLKEGRADARGKHEYDLLEYERLKTVVRDFKEASGIELNTWNRGQEIGEAVKAVLSGSVVRNGTALRRIAAKILEEVPGGDL